MYAGHQPQSHVRVCVQVEPERAHKAHEHHLRATRTCFSAVSIQGHDGLGVEAQTTSATCDSYAEINHSLVRVC
jgi:hypothetical protein